MSQSSPRAVIVGGRFGGLATAKALKNASAEGILIERLNHSCLSAIGCTRSLWQCFRRGKIGFPIRRNPRKQKNTTVILGELTGVDMDRKVVFASSPDRANVSLVFDFLILATGGI